MPDFFVLNQDLSPKSHPHIISASCSLEAVFGTSRESNEEEENYFTQGPSYLTTVIFTWLSSSNQEQTIEVKW